MNAFPPPADLPVAWARRAFASLRHRNYRLFFTGSAISLIGNWMQSAAQSWLVYDLTGSKAMLGLVGVVGTIPIVLFSTFGGMLADSGASRRRILMMTQASAAVLALALGALATADALGWATLSVWHLMVLAGLLGVVGGIEMPARHAFVAELVDREDLLNAIALNSSVFHAARIVGPAIAGLLRGGFGPGPCFVVNGLSYAATLAALAAMRLDRRAAVKHGAGETGLTFGFRMAARTPGVAVLLGLTFVIGTFGWSYVVLLPAFARDVFGATASGYGLMMSFSGAGSVIGALAVASVRNRGHGRQVLFAAMTLLPPSLLAFSLTDFYPLALVCLALTGMALSAFFASTNTMIQSSVDDAVRGRVMGVYTFVFGLMMPVGAFQAGALAESIGSAETVQIGAGIVTVAAVVGWRLLRRTRP